MKSLIIIPLLLLTIFPLNSFASFTETFDGINSIADTHFPNIYLSGGGIYALDTLSVSQGAPINSDLPISSGGDKEFRYYEGDSIAGSHSYATTSEFEIYNTVTIAGYVGAGITSTFGGRSSGLMARVTGSGVERNGYLASVFYSNTDASFAISRLDKGIVKSLVIHTSAISFDSKNENFYIELALLNDSITASLWKIPSNQEKTLITTLIANDDTYSSGGIGLYGFTRSSNSIFFDDITVTTPPRTIIDFLSVPLYLLLKNQN